MFRCSRRTISPSTDTARAASVCRASCACTVRSGLVYKSVTTLISSSDLCTSLSPPTPHLVYLRGATHFTVRLVARAGFGFLSLLMGGQCDPPPPIKLYEFSMFGSRQPTEQLSLLFNAPRRPFNQLGATAIFIPPRRILY